MKRIVKSQIKQFNTRDFLDEHLYPNTLVKNTIRKDYGKFFIVKSQDLYKGTRSPLPPTKATSHTLMILTKGKAVLSIGFQKVEIAAKECVVIPAGQVVSYEEYADNEGFVCTFDTSFILGKMGTKELLKEWTFLSLWANPLIKLGDKSSNIIVNVFERVFNEYDSRGLENDALIKAYLIAILCELQVCYYPAQPQKKNAAEVISSRFKETLSLKITEWHKVSEYAEKMQVSPNHLNKCLKSTTGKSAKIWIEEMIVLEAKVLLFQSNKSINEVGSDVGIFDASYFSRIFKKQTGMSPLEFRKWIEKS